MRGAGSWAANLIVAFLLLAVPLVTPAGAAALGAPGQLDPTFHGGTPVLEDLAQTVPHFTDFNNLLVDGAGRIVVAGQTTDSTGHTAVALGRFSTDGVPDATFGEGGFRVTQFGAGPSPFSIPQSLFLVPGRYVGFGIYRIINNDRSDPSAYVVGENGAGDPGFGNAGLATVDFPEAPSYGSTGAAAAAPDGTVYVSGTTTEGGTQHAFEVTKFTPQGQWGAFPVLGSYLKKFGEAVGAESTGGPIATMPDGSAVIAGTASRAAGGNGLLLVHLSEEGRLETSFGEHAGYSIINISDPKDPSPYAAPIDILIGPQNEIYVAGIGDDANGQQAAVIARFGPSGQPDFTFGNAGGIERIQLGGPGERSAATNLALQPDGKIIVMASVTDTESNSHPRILRLLPNGSLDPSFGNGGIVIPDLGGEETFVGGAAVVGNRLLVSGSVKGVTGYSGALAAYLLAPLPDRGPEPPTKPNQGPVQVPVKGQPPVQVKGPLRLLKNSLEVDAKGRVDVPLACSAAGPCVGRIMLLSKPAKLGAAKAMAYANGHYKIAAKAKETVTLTLDKEVRRHARAKGGIPARLVASPRGSGATEEFQVALHR